MLNAKTEITPKDEFLQQTEYILARVAETRDFSIGFDYVNRLLDGKKVIDSSVSVVLDGMEKEWIPSEHESETFLAATVRETGLSPETIRRHTNNQWLLKSGKIPEEFKESIENAGEKSLVQIANVARVYELEHDDWLRFAEAAGDEQKVGKIARKIKGVPPRSNWLMITVDETGMVAAHTKEEPFVELFRMPINSESPAAQKALARITGCAGIQPRVDY